MGSAMKYFGLMLVMLFLLVCIPVLAEQNQIVIGAFISKSGDSASYGPGVEAAIDLAISDLNDSYAKSGMNITAVVKKTYVDGTAEGAIKGAQDLYSQGAQIFVEPSSSEEVAAILPFLTEKGIISVSGTSSVALSLPDDPVVRLCPDDRNLIRALFAFNYPLIRDSPGKGVILVRDDLYGKTFSEEVKKRPNISEVITYPQNTKDFTVSLEKLDMAVASLIQEYGEKKIAIFVISFDEIADIMAQASAYPNLQKVSWQGMDSVALNPALITNETAAAFAGEVGLIGVSYNIAQPASSDYWRVYDAVKAVKGDHQPSIYEILPYDETLMAAWILQNNPKSVKDGLYIADNYGKYSYGATGWLKLNENSDREFGDYFFYQVQKNAQGTYSWMPTNMYESDTNSVISLTGLNNSYMNHFSG